MVAILYSWTYPWVEMAWIIQNRKGVYMEHKEQWSTDVTERNLSDSRVVLAGDGFSKVKEMERKIKLGTESFILHKLECNRRTYGLIL